MLHEVHRYDEAAASFEAALTTPLDDGSRAKVRFELAETLWDTRRAPPRVRAIELAQRRGRTLRGGDGQDHALLARIDAWLRTHGHR
jgi:hypothetical protein